MVNDYKSIQIEGKTVFAKAVFSNFQREIKTFTADEACFMFLSKGSFNLRTPDKVIPFQQGDGMLAKCGNYYVERPAGTDGNLEVVAVYFFPAMVKAFFPADLSLSDFKPDFDANQFPMDEMLYHFMDGINFLLHHPELVSDHLVLLKIKELLLLLAKTDKAPNVHAFITSLFKPYEYDFRETVLRNATANLSLPEFAHLCNMSLATFKRRFSAVFGESPTQFFTKEKLKKATCLLAADPTTRISDIVYDCGFDTLTHFNKVFKREFGVSPTGWRLSQNDKRLNP